MLCVPTSTESKESIPKLQIGRSGASSYNPNLTHMQGINPALESIEVVDVVTNSFDAEQGLAGGAAINLQIKSGTNEVHGSAFWYHNNQRF